MTMVEKTGIYAAIFLIVTLLCLIIFSENGILDYKALKGKELVLSDQTGKIDIANKRLENEIQSLKTDLDYIKHVAKHEHDMAEKDEFIFKNKSPYKGKTQ